MPVLNRAFEHVVPGIIPAPVPTISLPNLTSSGAAMPPNRTILPANYQVPAHSLRLASPQVYQQRLRPPQPGQIQVVPQFRTGYSYIIGISGASSPHHQCSRHLHEAFHPKATSTSAAKEEGYLKFNVVIVRSLFHIPEVSNCPYSSML